MSGSLILTAALGDADFAYFDRLRRAHYPAERNHVPAHLTMFHSLPPSAEQEAKGRLAELAKGPQPTAVVAGLMDLGGGVAFRIQSAELESIREEIANHFHGSLTSQDAGGWRPHITIQNKVDARTARWLKEEIERDFESRPLRIVALELHRYRDGPWEKLGRFPFRG